MLSASQFVARHPARLGNTAPRVGSTEDQWFDARELWWTRHYLSAGADGARLPNVSLIRAGDRLVIEWGPAEFPGDHAPRFISENGQGSDRLARR